MRKLSSVSTIDLPWIVFLTPGKTEIEICTSFLVHCATSQVQGRLPNRAASFVLILQIVLKCCLLLNWTLPPLSSLLLQIWPQEDQELSIFLFPQEDCFHLLCSWFLLKKKKNISTTHTLKHTFLTIFHLYYIGFFLNPRGLDSENTSVRLQFSVSSYPHPIHMAQQPIICSPSWRPPYKQEIGWTVDWFVS